MVEKTEQKKEEKPTQNIQQKPQPKRWKKALAIAAITAFIAGAGVIGYKKMMSNTQHVGYIIKKEHEKAFDILAEGVIRMANELSENKAIPVIQISQTECDPYKIITEKNTKTIIVYPIEINANGKNGDTTFMNTAKNMDAGEFNAAGCTIKNEGKVIECTSLEAIEKICEGKKPTCKGGALANLTGNIKNKIEEVVRQYFWLLGNGSCDKRDVIIKDGKNKAVIIGYDENKMPEAKGTDCKVGKPAAEPEVFEERGSVGTK